MTDSHNTPSLPSGERERSFTLSISTKTSHLALLSEGCELLLNTETGHFRVENRSMENTVTADGTFSLETVPFVLALLSAWPSYIRHNKLLQAATQKPGEEVAQLLDTDYERAISSLRQMAETCRSQFHQIGIDIEDVGGQGYKLSRYHTEEGAQI